MILRHIVIALTLYGIIIIIFMHTNIIQPTCNLNPQTLRTMSRIASKFLGEYPLGGTPSRRYPPGGGGFSSFPLGGTS